MPYKTPSSSRRALLAAGVGALGAALFRSPVARAADGNAAIIGATNSATNTTTFRNSDVNESALWGDAPASSGTGVGVRGDSAATAGRGVWGIATGTYTGNGNHIGVDGVAVGGLGIGVRGEADDQSGTGVLGSSTHGVGVFAASQNGSGIKAYSATATAVDAVSYSSLALHTVGRVKFERASGVATIPAGATAVTVSAQVGVDASSFVLLTPKANLGSRSLWFTTDATNDRFTIRISSSRPTATRVAWLLVG